MIINVMFTWHIHVAFITWPQGPGTIQSRRREKLKSKENPG